MTTLPVDSATSPLVDTVLGPVPAGSLGFTQIHEHILVDCRDPPPGRGGRAAPPASAPPPASVPPPASAPPAAPIRLETVYDARYRGDNQESLLLDSVDDAIEAVKEFGSAGGGTIVDVTPVCLGRRPGGLVEVARGTGVQVVMGCGYYVHEYHESWVCSSSVEALRDLIVRDCTEGVLVDGALTVKAGVIGEIGLNWPPTRCETAALVAASSAQRATGKALVVHPGRDRDAPLHAVRLAVDSGADPTRVVMSHIDRTLADVEEIAAVARTGAFVAFDLFGSESAFYPYSAFVMPNDGVRLRLVAELVEAGLGDRVLLSHDIYSKVRTSRYGGEGYAHILSRVVPLMERFGLDRAEQQRLLVANPRAALAGPG